MAEPSETEIKFFLTYVVPQYTLATLYSLPVLLACHSAD